MYLNQRFGLSMIIATLLVMFATIYLLFDYQRDNRETMARAQGLDLVRLLGGMSWNELVPEPGSRGFLELLKQGQSNPDFAYAAVIDSAGNIATEVTRAGVIVPAVKITDEPTNWLAQRVLAASETDQSQEFIESHAPVFSGDQHRGFVRVGYFQPDIRYSYSEMPFLATVMLPIFLLVPFFYLMLRREIRPLQSISERFGNLADQVGIQSVELQPSQALSDFMEQFGSYIEATQSRIKALSEQHQDLEMSAKLLTYKNNRVDAILQNHPDAILVIDEAGEVSYANGKTQRFLGVDPDSILGKKTREWCDIAEVIPLLTFAESRSNLQANQSTIQVKIEDNSEKSLQFNVYPLFTPKDENRILGRLVVIRDVTETHVTGQRQNEFISHISHELKTPLNVLSMYSESLLTNGADDEQFRNEAVNVIHDEVERLSTLINNLLAINQHELGAVSAQRKHVRMHDFLEDVFANVTKPSQDKGLVFELDIPREMSMVSIDKDLFRIAINNLLTNAIKYSKPGGKVTLSASEDDNSVEIVVSDDGYGISESDKTQIFNKFFRATDENIRKQSGHGLGLPLARQIVLMHHGDLSCSSEIGKGSRFVIHMDKLLTQMTGAAS